MAQGGYLVSGKDGEHLPTTTDGKLDHHLMGAAWAALHDGYRGNKYEGPGKSEAIAKLRKLYEREGMKPPGEEQTSSAAICAILQPGEAPKSIMLVPAGKFSPRDNREPWVNDDPEAVLAATRALGMEVGLPIDYDHATDLAAPEGRPAPAAGWLKRFFTKAGEIWADVEWTPAGAAAVAAGEWRYISPVFDFTKKGRHVTRIMRAALTNNPALYDTAIAARSSRMEITTEQFRAKMAAMFGVAGDATLEAICAAGEKKGMDADEFRAKMAAKFGCAKGASHEDICAAAEKHTIKKAKADAKDGDGDDDMDDDKAAARLIATGKVVSQETHTALLTRVNGIEAERKREKAAVKVDAAIREGKLQDAQRDWAIAYCAADESGFDGFVAKQVPLQLGPDHRFEQRPPSGTAAVLTREELAICTNFGIKPEDFINSRAEVLKRPLGENKPASN